MASDIVQGVIEVQRLIGRPPVIVGGLAVLARLPNPYRATVDLDVVDRLYASAHAWANDTATDMTIEVIRRNGDHVEVTTPVAEPGQLIAMKLQAIMNRSVEKQGTDLRDIVNLTFDSATRPVALAQIGAVAPAMASDIALHVDLWFVHKRQQALRWIGAVGGVDVTADDLGLVAELLGAAARRD